MLPRQKLEALTRRLSEIEQLLCDPKFLADQRQLTNLNRERAEVAPVVEAFGKYMSLERTIAEDREALSGSMSAVLKLPTFLARVSQRLWRAGVARLGCRGGRGGSTVCWSPSYCCRSNG